MTSTEMHRLADGEFDDLPVTDLATGFRVDLPEELVPTQQRTQGKVTWTYLGQMTFSSEHTAPPTAYRTFHAEDRPTSIRLQAFDALGRHWETDTVWPAIEASTDAPPMTGRIEWLAQQWTAEDCLENEPGGPVQNEHHWWNGNSQVNAFDDGLHAWEANSVLVNNNAAASVCSGAFVSASGRGEPEWVLTSAHCIEAGSLGRFAFPADIEVISADEREHYDVATVFIPHSYTSWPGSDFRSDIALLQLTPRTKLSTQATGALLDFEAPRYRLATSGTVTAGEPGRMVSWPHRLENCEIPPWEPYSNVDDEFGKQRRRHLQLYMDGGPGQSGSPIGRCHGDCNARSPGEIISVLSGWNGLTRAHIGPWVPFYAESLNGVMQ